MKGLCTYCLTVTDVSVHIVAETGEQTLRCRECLNQPEDFHRQTHIEEEVEA